MFSDKKDKENAMILKPIDLDKPLAGDIIKHLTKMGEIDWTQVPNEGFVLDCAEERLRAQKSPKLAHRLADMSHPMAVSPHRFL